MYYLMEKQGLREIGPEDWNSCGVKLGYVTTDELAQQGEALNVSPAVQRECATPQTKFRNSVDVYEDFTFCVVNVINLLNAPGERDRIALIVRGDSLLVVRLTDRNRSTEKQFLAVVNALPRGCTLERATAAMLQMLLTDGTAALERTEKAILAMEGQIVDGRYHKEMDKEIFRLRQQLSVRKNYYEQLIDIADELEENENDIFAEEGIKFFKNFGAKAQRLSLDVQAQSESLVHLRESLDAALNYSLNQTMKLMTVLTSLFLPLNLIAAWYGMNFTTMPELSWQYGYVAVIVASIVIVGLNLVVIIRRKML